ncbi:MAG: HD domain-containing protein [Candidatus Saganbacteria bacterium]|nr:HD domain-containing protein [Candidatus Saganbacteria bacterium]
MGDNVHTGIIYGCLFKLTRSLAGYIALGNVRFPGVLKKSCERYLQRSPYDEKVKALIKTVLEKIPDYTPGLSFNIEKFRFAAGLAAALHDKETKPRATGEAYFYHPLGVAGILVEKMHETDEVTLIAAILHDIVEDTSMTKEQVAELFGQEVAELVDGMTIAKQALKEQNMEKFVAVLKKDPRLLKIKLADRAYNLLHPKPGKPPDVANAQEALEFYDPLGVLTGQMKAVRHLADIAFKIVNPQRQRELAELIRTTMDKQQALIADITARIKRVCPEAEVLAKPRTPYELFLIETLRGKPAHPLYDIVMFQVTVPAGSKETPYSNCYAMLGTVHELGRPMEVAHFRDYIKDPKINAYQSLHTAIDIDGTVIRFQIRTPEMQRIAELGVFAKCYTTGHFVKPKLVWLESAFLEEFFRKDLPLREKLQLINDLTRCREAIVGVSRPGAQDKALTALLPSDVSPLEALMIASPPDALCLESAVLGSSNLLITTQRKGRIAGGTHFYLGTDPKPLDYFALLESNLARTSLIRYLERLPQTERDAFLKKVLSGALAGANQKLYVPGKCQNRFLTLEDLEAEEQALKAAGLPTLTEALYMLSNGTSTACDLAAKYADPAVHQKSGNPRQVMQVRIAVQGMSGIEVREMVGKALGDLFGDLDKYQVHRSSGKPYEAEAWVPVYSPLQQRQLSAFLDHLRVRGLTITQHAPIPTIYPNLYRLGTLNENDALFDAAVAGEIGKRITTQNATVTLFFWEPTTEPVPAAFAKPWTNLAELGETLKREWARVGLEESSVIFLAAPRETLTHITREYHEAIARRCVPFVLVNSSSPFGQGVNHHVIAAFLGPHCKGVSLFTREMPLPETTLRAFLTGETEGGTV